MEKKEQLCNAIKKIGWGYILLYFDINIGTIDILPGWLSYVFFYQAIQEGISTEEESSSLLKPLGAILGIYQFINWFLNILGVPMDVFLVNELESVISLYFHFQLLTNLANIARKYGCEQEQSLLKLRTVLTVLMTVLAFTVHFEEIYWLSICIVIIQVVVMISICIVLRNFKHTLENIPNEMFEKDVVSG